MLFKDARYIFKKILIGVGIAILLMLIKGQMMLDVHAQASALGTAGQVYDSCSNCHELHTNTGSSWANWSNGTLSFNGAIFNYAYGYGGQGQERFTQIVANVYVVANDIPYSCKYSVDNNQLMYYSDNSGDLSTYQTTGFSVQCSDITPGAKGIQSINVQGLGLVDQGIGFRIYSPITFATNDNQSQTSQITTNNTQNTDREIANSNANTDKQIDSQKVCKKYDKSSISVDGKYLVNNGTYVSDSNYGITNYIKINDDTTITSLTTFNSVNANFCFYDVNKDLISCSYISSLTANSDLTIPTNASYFRSSISKLNNKPTYKVCNNGNQAMSDSVNDVNDTLNDDSVDGASSEGASFFDDFQTDSHGGISGIVTAPLRLINSLSSSSCSSLTIPLPFVNNDVVVPCMSTIYSQYFGSFLTLYQLITTGLIGYWVAIKLFAWVRRLQRPDDDRIEVLDL